MSQAQTAPATSSASSAGEAAGLPLGEYLMYCNPSWFGFAPADDPARFDRRSNLAGSCATSLYWDEALATHVGTTEVGDEVHVVAVDLDGTVRDLSMESGGESTFTQDLRDRDPFFVSEGVVQFVRNGDETVTVDLVTGDTTTEAVAVDGEAHHCWLASTSPFSCSQVDRDGGRWGTNHRMDGPVMLNGVEIAASCEATAARQGRLYCQLEPDGLGHAATQWFEVDPADDSRIGGVDSVAVLREVIPPTEKLTEGLVVNLDNSGIYFMTGWATRTKEVWFYEFGGEPVLIAEGVGINNGDPGGEARLVAVVEFD